MKISCNENLSNLLDKKYIFLDNDFLSGLFHKKEIYLEFIEISSSGQLVLDPHTEFEFLRDVYIPRQRELKGQFLSSEIFVPLANHSQIFNNLQENALLLSRIYAHNKTNGASYVDLFLAARLMLYHKFAVIITSNKKDFPICIFDTLRIINIEQKDSTVRPYYILSFAMERFDTCYKDLMKIS